MGVHYNQTGFFREVYADELGVLEGIKKYMAMLPAYNLEFFRVDEPKSPALKVEDLYDILTRNTK